jgi:diguanylate cyclase (GGDEF)-like protein
VEQALVEQNENFSQAQSSVRPLVTIDPGTGVLNAHGWIAFAKRHLKRAVYSQQRLGLVLVRVENLAQIKADGGAKLMEGSMQHVAEALQLAVRPGDLLGRWREAEFIILLPYVDAGPMEQIAERLVQGVRKRPLLVGAQAVMLTFATSSASMLVIQGELQELDALIATCERQVQSRTAPTISGGLPILFHRI